MARRPSSTPKKTAKKWASPIRVDLVRWYQSQSGKSVEEIAAIHGIRPAAVQNSIDRVEEWKRINSAEIVNAKANEIAIAAMDNVAQVWKGAMGAMRTIVLTKGRTKDIPDHKMRLMAVNSVKSLAELSQPKGVGLQLNQQFNNGQTAGGAGSSVSFESILRKKREQRGLVSAQDAEILHRELTHEEEIEEEFKDFGGNDDEDEDDGDDEE